MFYYFPAGISILTLRGRRNKNCQSASKTLSQLYFWDQKIIPTQVSASLLPWNVHVNDDHGSNLSLPPLGRCHEVDRDDSSDDQDLQGLQDPTSSKGALPRNNSALGLQELKLRGFSKEKLPRKWASCSDPKCCRFSKIFGESLRIDVHDPLQPWSQKRGKVTTNHCMTDDS